MASVKKEDLLAEKFLKIAGVNVRVYTFSHNTYAKRFPQIDKNTFKFPDVAETIFESLKTRRNKKILNMLKRRVKEFQLHVRVMDWNADWDMYFFKEDLMYNRKLCRNEPECESMFKGEAMWVLWPTKEELQGRIGKIFINFRQIVDRINDAEFLRDNLHHELIHILQNVVVLISLGIHKKEAGKGVTQPKKHLMSFELPKEATKELIEPAIFRIEAFFLFVLREGEAQFFQDIREHFKELIKFRRLEGKKLEGELKDKLCKPSQMLLPVRDVYDKTLEGVRAGKLSLKSVFDNFFKIIESREKGYVYLLGEHIYFTIYAAVFYNLEFGEEVLEGIPVLRPIAKSAKEIFDLYARAHAILGLDCKPVMSFDSGEGILDMKRMVGQLI